MNNRILSGLSLLVACVLLARPAPAQAGGGGGGGGGPCAGFSAGDTLVMRDNCFDGVAHFAERGARLTVQNKGEYPHSFTAVDGSFDTGVLSPGETAEIQLGEDGIVKVVCTLHGTAHGLGMAGVLLVGDPVVGEVGHLSGPTQAITAQEGGQPEPRPEAELSDPRSSIGTVALIGGGGLLGVVAFAAVRYRRGLG